MKSYTQTFIKIISFIRFSLTILLTAALHTRETLWHTPEKQTEQIKKGNIFVFPYAFSIFCKSIGNKNTSIDLLQTAMHMCNSRKKNFPICCPFARTIRAAIRPKTRHEQRTMLVCCILSGSRNVFSCNLYLIMLLEAHVLPTIEVIGACAAVGENGALRLVINDWKLCQTCWRQLIHHLIYMTYHNGAQLKSKTIEWVGCRGAVCGGCCTSE